jgi:predicted metal-dependent phosphoesterase TrpH
MTRLPDLNAPANERPIFDLQAHSTCSDGTLAPAAVVARAAGEGVEVMALTDHDTVDGVPEAAAAARAHVLRFSPAAELSAVHRPDADVHILGYELRLDGALLDALSGFRADRARRIEAMAQRLGELGLQVDDGELRARREQGLPLGRPHLASAVLTDANAARLDELGVQDRDSLFAALLVPGAPAYVPRTRPTTADAIAAIHAAGGVAVWAHPYWDEDEPLPVLDRFVGEGIDGVECFYATHTEEQVRTLHAACRKHDLLITGSADFHGPENERFGRFRAFSLYGLSPDLGPIAA